MKKEKAASASPFSALTYQEQQDRWMEWRSRQLHYKPFREEEAPAPKQADTPEKPRLRTPNMPIALPYQRRELNQVFSRHQKAVRQAGAFQAAAIDPENP
ncbi:MAG: hypothetical protein IKQ41_06085 [Clostridia bacterium]|nr:hypothetical protein [Clostridia bacterium]